MEMTEDQIARRKRFKTRLTELLNSLSCENGSNTPDFILAEYLCGCMDGFDRAMNTREGWYGRLEEPVVTTLDGPSPNEPRTTCTNHTGCPGESLCYEQKPD